MTRMTPGPQYNVARLLAIGLIFHLVYIASVFDCYFKSPVVSGMQRYQLDASEAKRLVLIVGDGLRADSLFSQNAFSSVPDAPPVVAPHLHSIAKYRGSFGISHTRVPTESRPGHVALIAGMYEDVSAVTKGWKNNPVDFDSVFNQSSHTFSFGSPDILPMFSRGATPGRVETWTYDEEDEDFTKDATDLDLWVLERLRELFHNATTDPALDARLRQSRTVFFLHLIGLDTTGHAYRPHSKEYMNSIRIVDTIVRQTEVLFTEFYKDEETSFIFTADHGMSNIGNHGDGDPDNTRTPLIAWGRGIRGPVPDSQPTSHDAYSASWGLGHLLRRDIEQADVTAIMASLIGIPWPINSVGVLPDVDPTRPGYLNPKEGEAMKATAALVNAKVILDHYRVKHEKKWRHTLFYKPFIGLEGVGGSVAIPRVTRLLEIEELIGQKDWFNARLRTAELIKHGLAALRYLETYDRFLIWGIVTAAYLGWFAYSSLYVFRPPSPLPSRASSVITLVMILAALGFWACFAIQKSPWTFYIYILFPFYFWHQFFRQAVHSYGTWMHHRPRSAEELVRAGLWGALVIVVLQSMASAYTNRSIWSIGFGLMAVAWPLFAWPAQLRRRRPELVLSWLGCCLITAIFPLLAVDKKESLRMIMLGGSAMLAVGCCSAVLVIRKARLANGDPRVMGWLLGIQLLLLGLAMAITMTAVLSLQAKAGLPMLSQISGWLVFTIAPLVPFLSPVKHTSSASKTLMYFLGFAPCFVILAISIEGIFYLAYSATLVVWVEVEVALRGPSKAGATAMHKFQPDDLRIALFFLFFAQVGFFGTGNVASISSFYLEPVYRLVPIFRPFLMAALLVFKIVAPYIMLSAAFSTLNARLNMPPFSLFVVALTLADGMTLTFFFNVTDTGSWLEIGQSISFFCITSLLLVWSGGICAAGDYLMADTNLRLRSAIMKAQ